MTKPAAHAPRPGPLDNVKNFLYAVAQATYARSGVRRFVNGSAIYLPIPVARYFPSSYEPEKYRFVTMHCEPGSIAIDVGAHLGLFTVAMARGVGASGRVWALEPNPAVTHLLRQTVAFNPGSSRVVVLPAAAGRYHGVQFLTSTDGRASNAASLAPGADFGGAESVAVPVLSIDGLLGDSNQRVSCIKIDAEGSEYDILAGARETLKLWQPALAIEVHPILVDELGGSLAALWSLLTEAGYVLSRGASRMTEAAFCALDHAIEIQAVPRAR